MAKLKSLKINYLDYLYKLLFDVSNQQFQSPNYN